MSTKNNKSVASQALLDLDAIRGQIKEESKNTLKSLLSEAVKEVIREEASEDEDEDMTIESEGADEKDEQTSGEEKHTGDVSEDGNGYGEEPEVEETPEAGAEASNEPASDALEAPEDGEGENDEWSQFGDYQVAPNTYDFTNVSPDDEEGLNQIYKVYKLMKDEDQVVVRKEGDTLQLQDNETGAEYVIDLGGEEEEGEVMNDSAEQPMEGQPVAEGRIMEGDFDFDLGDMNQFNEEDDLDDIDEDDFFHNDGLKDDEQLAPLSNRLDIAGLPENKNPRKTMRENREFELVLEGDIHDYTDNYQNVDPIDGLSADEPSKSGKSWEKGVPTGTKKPWAGDSKSKGKPFGKKAVDENLDEVATSVSTQATRNAGSKVHTSAPRKNFLPKKSKHISAEGEYNETLGESYKKVVADLVAENKKLKAELEAKVNENKELKETVLKVRQGLHENRVTTVNLAKITKLFVENAVSQSEKASIINRFSNEAKTIEQSKALYESINKELKKGVSSPVSINEASMTVTGSKAINENKTPKSKDLLETLDFIKRMENC